MAPPVPARHLGPGAVDCRRNVGICAARPGHGFRHHQGRARWRGPRRDGDGHQHADPADPHDRYGRQRLLYVSKPSARPLRRRRGARGIQADQPAGGAARCRLLSQRGFHARDRCADRGGHRHGRGLDAADRRGGPQDDRGEGHRAALVCRPQPDRRARAKAWGDRRQFQQRGRLLVDDGRLQHQRQPLGRERHLRRRRRSQPHPVERGDHRRAERRRGAGSAGADRQLHAGVRPIERRTDPVRDQGWEQPLQRQRVVLLPGRVAAGEPVGPQPQPRSRAELRTGAVQLQAVRLLVRGAHPWRDVPGPPVLLRRAGMGELLPGRDEYRHGAHGGDAGRRLQRAARRESVLQLIAADP